MSHSLFHGWKTRLFHLSSHPRVLATVTIGLLAGGFLLACAIVAFRGSDNEGTNPAAIVKKRFQKRLDAIISSPKDHTRPLAAWLHDVTVPAVKLPPDVEITKDISKVLAKAGASSGFDLKDIVRQHIPDAQTRSCFEDYIDARVQGNQPIAQAAQKRLETASLATPTPAFANQFLGDLLYEDGKAIEAMAAYRREGTFPDARRARALAFDIAAERKDMSALHEMLAIPAYRQDASPSDLHRIALLLGDWGLVASSYFRMETQDLRPTALVFVFAAGFLWYAVFVRFGVRERWRWVRPLPALLAGVASIWPTMILIHWLELSGGKEENGEFLHDLVFYVTGVGFREETAKLALFALFIPWLLKQRSPGKALLTGAFVGLGFAMDENRGYFHSGGGLGAAAVGRFLTANFFHAAATGLTGHALYELVRTRFGSAERFLVTFIGVVVVHGVYDWVLGAGSSLQTLGNLGMFSIIILALLAQQFFDLLGTLIQPRRGLVSLLGLFLVGLSALIAAGFVVAAAQAGTLAAVSAVGREAVGLVPIAVMYSRKFVHL